MEPRDMILTEEDTAIAGRLTAAGFGAWLWEVRDGRDYAKVRLDMKRAEFGWLPAARIANDFCDVRHL